MEALYLEDDAALMAERARESVAAGYTAVKVLVVPRTAPLDGVAPLRHAERLMAAIREAVGDGVDVMIDLHGRTTPAMAIVLPVPVAPSRVRNCSPASMPSASDAIAANITMR